MATQAFLAADNIVCLMDVVEGKEKVPIDLGNRNEAVIAVVVMVRVLR